MAKHTTKIDRRCLYPRTLASGVKVWDIVANAAGQQKWERGFVGTVTQAAARRDELKAELRAGKIGTGAGRMKLGDFMETKWLPTRKGKAKAENTKRSYGYRLARIKRSELGLMRLDRIQSYHVEAFIAQLQDELAANSVKNHYDMVKAALTKAAFWKDIPFNPCEGIDTPAKGKKREPKLTNDEIQHLIDVAYKLDRLHDTHYGDLVFFTLNTGLRWAEVTTLLWSEIDFGRSQLDIPVAKSQSGERGVALGPETLECLQDHRIKIMARLRKLDPDAAVPDLVFPNKKLQQWDDASFWSEWVKIREAAGFAGMDVRTHGVEDLTFHDLRHLHSTLGAKAGVHPTIMSNRLGHSDTSFSLNQYTHVTNTEEQRPGAIAIESLLKRPK